MAGSAGAPGLSGDRAVGQRQVFHGLVDAGQLAPGHRQVPGHPGAAGQHDRVIGGAQRFRGNVGARFDAAAEFGALGPHLVQPPVQVPLLQLELGNAVAQQAAGRVVAFEHGDRVTGPGQLLGRREPGRARADHRHRTAGPGRRGPGHHPAGREGPVDDLHLDLLDRDGIGVDPEHTGGFARRWAKPPGELGEVVGGVQAVGGLPPVVPPDQVVPLRDQVAQRAPVMAERDAAVHAPARLPFQPAGRERLVDLVPVEQPQVHGTTGRGLAGRGHEALRVSHELPP